MAKGRFKADKKPDKKKVIEVEVEDQVMTITREDGKPPDVRGGTEGQLDLNKLPDDTVVFTHTNPTCGYYYWNGRWWYL